jgi:hypothetical protein
MRNSFKYIFSFLLILSFFGFGESTPISCSSVRNLKETEWIVRANSNADFSKCYHYNPCNQVKEPNFDIPAWSNDVVIFYNRIVTLKLISQSKIYSIVKVIHLIINKLNISSRSIEYHFISSRQDKRNIMWNYILKWTWIIHQIKHPDTSMDLSVF